MKSGSIDLMEIAKRNSGKIYTEADKHILSNSRKVATQKLRKKCQGGR